MWWIKISQIKIENNAPENNKTDDKNKSENVDENIDNALIEDDIRHLDIFMNY